MSDIGQSAEAPASRTVVIDSDRALSSLRASLLSPSLPSEETRIVLDPNRFGSAAAEVEARVNALYAACARWPTFNASSTSCSSTHLALRTRPPGAACSTPFANTALRVHEQARYEAEDEQG